MSTIGTIQFKRGADANQIARLGPVHLRLFRRLRNVNVAPHPGGTREKTVHSTELLRHILSDPKANCGDVTWALVDLQREGFVEIEFIDAELFKQQAVEVARELEMERLGNRHAAN